MGRASRSARSPVFSGAGDPARASSLVCVAARRVAAFDRAQPRGQGRGVDDAGQVDQVAAAAPGPSSDHDQATGFEERHTAGQDHGDVVGQAQAVAPGQIRGPPPAGIEVVGGLGPAEDSDGFLVRGVDVGGVGVVEAAQGSVAVVDAPVHGLAVGRRHHHEVDAAGQYRG